MECSYSQHRDICMRLAQGKKSFMGHLSRKNLVSSGFLPASPGEVQVERWKHSMKSDSDLLIP